MFEKKHKQINNFLKRLGIEKTFLTLFMNYSLKNQKMTFCECRTC